MAIDPNIILQGRVPDLGAAAQQGFSLGQQFRQAPLRNQLLQQQVTTGRQGIQKADLERQVFAARKGVAAFGRGDTQGVLNSIREAFPGDEEQQNAEISQFQANPEAYIARTSDGITAFQNQFGDAVSPAKRQISQDIEGRKRFVDTGELVFKDVKTPKDLESEIKKDKTKFDQASKIRREVASATAVFSDVEDSFSRVEAATSGEITAASDLALIFNFMKMLDPGSVVREGEFATAQNAAGVPDRISNIYNKMLTGERLNKNQRENFVKEARKQFDSALKVNNKRVKDFVSLGKRFGLEKEDIIVRSEDNQRQDVQPGPVDTGITAEQFRAMTTEQRQATIRQLQGQ